MKKLIKNVLTGKDNETYDPARLGWLLSLLVFTFICIYDAIVLKQINLVSIAGGYATILAGGALGVQVKSNSEPLPEPPKKRGKKNDI